MTTAPAPAPASASGAGVRLRRLRGDDLRDFQAYRGDPEVGRWQGWQPVGDAAAADFLAGCATAPLLAPGAWCQLGIAEAAADTLVGDVGLHLAAAGDEVEIGFTLARHAQGRGWGGAAVALAQALVFDTDPAVQRLLAVTDDRNLAAIRLLDRAGWRRKAALPALFRGQPCLEQHFVVHRGGRRAPTLRPAGAADAAAVAAVLIVSRRELMPFAPSAHDDDDVGRWVESELIPGGGVTVAVDGDRVMGVLATAVRAGSGWIDQLAVRPAAVGAGIGAALLAHALATLPRPLRLFTFQANRHARDFYQHHGFSALAFGDGSGNEERCPDVVYGRDI